MDSERPVVASTGSNYLDTGVLFLRQGCLWITLNPSHSETLTIPHSSVTRRLACGPGIVTDSLQFQPMVTAIALDR